MRVRKHMTLGAAAALAVAGLGVGVSGWTATASPSTHHWEFSAITLRDTGSGNTFQSAEVEKFHGKVVGYDVVSGVFNPDTGLANLWVEVTRPGGTVHVHITQNGESDSFTGKITGGTGRYRNAQGTLTGHSVSDSVTEVEAEVTY